MDLATPSLEGAAELGGQYYDLAGDRVGRPPLGVVAATPPEEALKINARWAMSKGNQSTGLTLLVNSFQRRLFGTARESVARAAQSEPGARWARRARADACAFCRMLATRGATYRSASAATGVVGRGATLTLGDRRAIAAGTMTREEALSLRSSYSSAQHAAREGKSVGDTRLGQTRGTGKLGSQYHDKCRCLAVAVRPGTVYTPPAFTQQWEEDYKRISKDVGTNPDKVIEVWRKELHAA